MRLLILCVTALFASVVFSVSIAGAAPSLVKAGADSSGGGKSVVCRDGAGKILSIEMLDLYEARAMYTLEPLPMGVTLDEILAMAQAKLMSSSVVGELAGQRMLRLKERLKILPPGTRIEPVDDASPIALPQGCRLEQAAVWVDRGLVVADHELWHAMDSRNKASLIAHEVIYDITRTNGGEKNSRRARKIVGHAFSRYDFGDYREGIPNENFICFSMGSNARAFTSFIGSAGADGKLVANLTHLEGRILFGKNVVRFRHLKYNEDSAQQKWDSAEIESSFETENSFALRWDPTKPAGERFSATLIDANGQQFELPFGCLSVGTEPIDDGKSKKGGR